MQRFQLVLLIHAHQPVGNFEDVLERAYARSYLPFLEVLERHPAIRVGLHYSGSLLEWIEAKHPEYFECLRTLVSRGQAEIVGGGFYEPILVSIPSDDRIEQIGRLADYVEQRFGARPRGAWLAERVWEPQLPSALRAAGAEYTLVDDNHFLGAGFEARQLRGYYLAEDQGATVKVIPGLKLLRYLIPFREPGETIAFLLQAASQAPGGFAAMGDDLEKFGIWPGTHEHCYANGWLDRFFSEIEAQSEWLETWAPGEAVAARPPLGRADLPTASYTEMMEWALPVATRRRYHALTEEFSSRPADLPFIRGGIWRNFFSKYSESNLLHKKMLHVSEKVRRAARSRRHDKQDKKVAETMARAMNLLLQSQCNDAYWHGVFGGLYAPHLRCALWRPLIEAETLVDGLAHRGKHYADATRLDFDADGHEELYFRSDQYAALLKPDDGASICSLDFRPAAAPLINAITRRPEAYHALVNACGDAAAGGEVQSIHGQTHSKEEGLERWLHYDRWHRHAFRFLLFDCAKSQEDCSRIRLDEDAALAGGRYRLAKLAPERAVLVSEDSKLWALEKSFAFQCAPEGFSVACDVKLGRTAPGPVSCMAGIEIVLNFLAPSAPDRYFQCGELRFPLRWNAAVPASELRLVDEWQKIGATLNAPGARDYWVCPIETISESEDGYERIYQGSQIVAVWPVAIAPGGEWKCRLSLKMERLP